MSWKAKDARSRFGSLLDTAQCEGPQLVRRAGTQFVIVTEAELERRFAESPRQAGAKFINVWEALQIPPHLRLTEEEAIIFDRALASCPGR